MITGFIAFVWAFSGLICKVLNQVPRHRLIVARILGPDHARLWTNLIGVAEVVLAIWIITGMRSRLCTVLQVVTVLAMNLIEVTVVPDQLLFGRWNLLFAVLFICLVVYKEVAFSRSKTKLFSL